MNDYQEKHGASEHLPNIYQENVSFRDTNFAGPVRKFQKRKYYMRKHLVYTLWPLQNRAKTMGAKGGPMGRPWEATVDVNYLGSAVLPGNNLLDPLRMHRHSV